MSFELTENQKKALSLKHDIILTANAGSGKTVTLTNRLLNIYLSSDTPDMNSVVAITFTDLAAGELYRKLQDLINERIEECENNNNGEANKNLRKLLNLKNNLVNANISTIHSFCLNLLKEFPLETGLDAHIQTLDQFSAKEIITASIKSITKKWFDDSDRRKLLKDIYNGFSNSKYFHENLLNTIDKRELLHLPIFTAMRKEDSTEFFALLSNYENEIINCLSTEAEAKELGKYMNLRSDGTVPEITKIDKKAIDVIRKNLDLFNNNATVDRRKVKKFKLDIDLLESCNEWLKSVIVGLVPLDKEEELLENVFRFNRNFILFIDDILVEYERRKRERSFVDFTDMQSYVKQLLENDTVLEHLARRYRYILVDEYQDTNQLQYDIVKPLKEKFVQDNNLFVVGDDKQSIYWFRSAEPAVFRQTKVDISSRSATGVLSLQETFRLTPELCGFVNKVFSVLFGDSPIALFNETAHNETIAGLQDNRELMNSGVEFIACEKKAQAETTVRRILEFYGEQKGCIAWSDIAILVNKNENLELLSRALTKENIPCTIVGGKKFYSSQVVLDLSTYLEFLNDRSNDSALLALLRSPFYQISDDDLLINFSSRSGSMWERLNELAQEHAKWHEIVTKLNQLLIFAKGSKPYELLMKITEDSDFLTIAAAQKNGKQIIADYHKLIELCYSFSQSGIINLPEFVEYLKSAYAENLEESNADINSGKNGIQVMTIHKSKGLEFKAVFLYDAGSATYREKVEFPNKYIGFTAKLESVDENVPETSYLAKNLAKYHYKKMDLAEHKRKLYVALTRASNFLFIIYEKPENNLKANSFAGMLSNVFPMEGNSQEIFFVNVYSPVERTTELKSYSLEVKKSSSVEVQEKIQTEKQELTNSLPELLPKPQPFYSTSESFSATVFSKFSFCPLSYYLSDKISANSSLEYVRKKNTLSSPDADSVTVNSTLSGSQMGTYVHNLFNILPGTVISREEIDASFEIFLQSLSLDRNGFIDEKDRIIRYTNFFLNSVYMTDLQHADHKTELNLFTLSEDCLCEGRLDRLIETDEKLIILDYKTTVFNAINIEEYKEKYRAQMDFYAWIVQRSLNQKNKQIEAHLLFLHPEEYCIFIYNEEKFLTIERDISKMIRSIQQNQFSRNLKHCSICEFRNPDNTCMLPEHL